MQGKLNLLIVSGETLYHKTKKIIGSCGIDISIFHYPDYISFNNNHNKIPDLVFCAVNDINESRKLLSVFAVNFPGTPVVIIFQGQSPDADLYRDLIISGACGVVHYASLDPIIQYITKALLEREKSDDINLNIGRKIFEHITENHDSYLSVINSDFEYEEVNASFCEVHKCKKENVIGSTPLELWGDEIFKSKIESSLKKSLAGEIVKYKAYFDIPGSAGSCYGVIYRPYKAEGIDKRYTIVETRDITETDKAEKAVHLANIRNYYYEKYLPFGVFECDSNGKIISANETFYNILEIDPSGREKVNLTAFFPAERRFTSYLETITTGEASTFSQLHMTTTTGTEIFARISCHARKDPAFGIVINATLEDNTHEVLLERKLNQTHRLETLGTMAGGIAHDFNTILTTISGYSELSMEEADQGSVIHDYLRKVKHSVRKAEDIINQMLTFSRQIEIKSVPVKIEEVLEESCEFIKSGMPFNIYLEKEFEEVEGMINADPTQLFRVFINIMTNSIHSMEEKGGVLTVKLSESEGDSGSTVVVRIIDTGTGIDKSVINRIYEPFFTTREVGKGTGMGLSVAHGIIAGMGGEIGVESSVGKGTLFSV
ncbi:MAG: PAS domain-containing protein, partial [Bacteroidales bacterium]|nr:PAS domain-containing protein [Bacteroidales bacterium]